MLLYKKIIITALWILLGIWLINLIVGMVRFIVACIKSAVERHRNRKAFKEAMKQNEENNAAVS